MNLIKPRSVGTELSNKFDIISQDWGGGGGGGITPDWESAGSVGSVELDGVGMSGLSDYLTDWTDATDLEGELWMFLGESAAIVVEEGPSSSVDDVISGPKKLSAA